ncbi:Crp/Fnr family transcriptional regulator [Actinomycetospora straminea]|uniref:Crp/Fnr family transcriptional regulator n=1 Tax=Actinomycetospora straminea TaxID=663607 RepID=A0ABP9ECH6_9PSEU|nr:Crp/Fnr family transcriptional regulator [Actinomycetospora straminea]MDD7932153.1 Crp/Fnr family transcriptional regulator [Actinomycetospora straminea]
MAPRSVVPSPTVSPFLLAETGAVSRRIEALGVPRPVRAGDHLYRQGEPSSSFHVIVSGRVRIHMLRPDGTTRVISWAEPGASLGEGVCFDGGVNPVSATALTACEVLAIGRDVLVEAARDDPELLVEVVRRVARKQRVLHLHVFLDGLPARERVVLLLGHLVEAYGDGALGTSARLSVRPPVDELALMVGLTRVTTSREISRLVAEGVLQKDGRSIVVRDLPSLRRRVDAVAV